MTSRTEWAAPPPQVADVRLSLRRALGAEFDRVWGQLCGQAAIEAACEQLADEDFDRLLLQVGAYSPLCGVLAMSWRIRRTAARKLAEIGR